jgi:hypothetical protein
MEMVSSMIQKASIQAEFYINMLYSRELIPLEIDIIARQNRCTIEWNKVFEMVFLGEWSKSIGLFPGF